MTRDCEFNARVDRRRSRFARGQGGDLIARGHNRDEISLANDAQVYAGQARKTARFFHPVLVIGLIALVSHQPRPSGYG